MSKNKLEQDLHIREVLDPETNKSYNLHITVCIPENGPMADYVCYELYLTDRDPYHDVLVGIGRTAYRCDAPYTREEKEDIVKDLIAKSLPDGFKRFEAIMASGINGNELPK